MVRDYCRCCCCCCCCNTKLGVELHFHFCLLLLLLLLFVVLVAVACRVLFPFFLLCFSFPNSAGRAVAAASLALISGFRERGCRGLQVNVRVRLPCMWMCVSFELVCVSVLIHFLFDFAYLYCLPPRRTYCYTLVRLLLEHFDLVCTHYLYYLWVLKRITNAQCAHCCWHTLVLDTHCRVATDTKFRDVVCKYVDTTVNVERNLSSNLNNIIFLIGKLR